MSELGKLDRYARDYPEGAVIFEQGDAPDLMYVVQRGEIEIIRHSGSEPRIVALIPAGEFFGEMGLISGRPRTATARVRKAARLLELSAELFESMVQTRSEIAVRMIRTMSGRLERANRQVELLLLQDPSHRVVEFLRQSADGFGERSGDSVWLDLTPEELAAGVTLSVGEATDILQKLALARLVVHGSESAPDRRGYWIPSIALLDEYAGFLELKEQRAPR